MRAEDLRSLEEGSEAPGLGLLPQHATLLALSAIDVEVARARGYRSVTDVAELRKLGFASSQLRAPGLLIPIHSVDGSIGFHQLRPDSPRERNGKAIKYETCAGARMCLDVHPHIRDWLGDPKRRLWLTEGSRKTDAAVSLGLCCVGLVGVFGWRGTNEVGGTAALGDWESIALKGREIFVAFDSDVTRKSTVAMALQRLKVFLESRGATVYVVYLHDATDGAKVGLDDFIAAGGREADLVGLASRELQQQSESSPSLIACPYEENSEGLFLIVRGRNGDTLVPLANFTARIIANVIEDDGIAEHRAVDLVVRLAGREKTLRVSMADFTSLRWASEQVGADAIVFPGPYAREHVRVAIQMFSGEVPERRVFTHTGWRKLPSGCAYLHGDGAIGEHGAVEGVEVELPDDLDRFRLPPPAPKEVLIQAVDGFLKLRHLAPPEISAPMISLVPRAVMGGVDFSVHFVGRTGTFKTEGATLLQQALGPSMSSRALPASWLSTANSLEALCFAAKDALVVVDDFCPRGSSADVQRFHRDADRLLRAQGNRAGRQRMGADGTLRLTRPPRGTILSTGEDVPQGHSLQARVLVIEFGPKSIDPGLLTAAQYDACRGLYAQAIAGFIQWLAPRYDVEVARVTSRVNELRTGVGVDGLHRRTPEIIANLFAGWEAFERFAVELGALNPEVANDLREEIWRGLCGAASSQASNQATADHSVRFIELLRSAVASGSLHLATLAGGPPENAESFGWRQKRRFMPIGTEWESRGPRVGWLDGDSVYLEPGAAFAAVQSLARQQSEPLPVSQRTLHTRLADGGLLASTGGKRGAPVRRMIEGQRREVLHLLLETVFPSGTAHADHDDQE